RLRPAPLRGVGPVGGPPPAGGRAGRGSGPRARRERAGAGAARGGAGGGEGDDRGAALRALAGRALAGLGRGGPAGRIARTKAARAARAGGDGPSPGAGRRGARSGTRTPERKLAIFPGRDDGHAAVAALPCRAGAARRRGRLRRRRPKGSPPRGVEEEGDGGRAPRRGFGGPAAETGVM